ncbi:MAG: M23 family metallopeptidase [Desulfovibrio sp.]|jgi:murein DD-endopeptidase MepM/ murein hydrolase activator NlpD|nr:M23 family metallopeptidase [Desulfovibrio sp.]
MAKRSRFSLIFTIIIVSFIVFCGFMVLKDLDAPDISLSHGEDSINLLLPVTVTAFDESSIKSIEVVARFHDNEIPLVKKEFSGKGKSQSLIFTMADSGLKNNESFELEIIAVDNSFGKFGFGNKNKIVVPMRLDLNRPLISVKSNVPHVRRGGTGCVVYSLSKDVKQTGIKVGERFFPSFKQENGDYLCLFAFPYDLEVKEYNPQLAAVDKAGNQTVQSVNISAIPNQFKTDTINIRQSFLDAKAVEFESLVPEPLSDIERFLVVNRRIRRENAVRLLEIGQNTAPEMLWSGAFLRLPRAALRANFAERRTYLWEDKKIDEQTHLGFDLASIKQADVPAANSGNVVFAGYLGIYGNIIVIDHGMGLQSIYSHLSEIGVEIGRPIKKGDLIGKTGASGMAGGDHLHFGILIAGLEVNPQEWLDQHWIKDNVIDRIKEAGGKSPQFNISQENTPPIETRKTPSKAKPARKKR